MTWLEHEISHDFSMPAPACALMRSVASSFLFVMLLAFLCVASLAREGHDHGPEPKAGLGVPASPRIVATSEAYQLVGVVEGEVLVIYLDRAADNSPVTTATLEISLDGAPQKAELVAKAGTYEVTSPLLRKAGSYEVLVSLTDGAVSDLLVGTLKVPGTSEHGGPRSVRRAIVDALFSLPGGLVLLGGVSLAAVAALRAMRSRRSSLVTVLAVGVGGLSLLSDNGWAHEGHDHGPDLSASSGNSPARRPDGSIFVPKPTQRLLEIRTRRATVETKTKTVRFSGRIVANPNRSGVVQSTLQGRYEAPEGGVPPLGTAGQGRRSAGQGRSLLCVDQLLRHGPDARHARSGDCPQSTEARPAGATARQQRRGESRGRGHPYPAGGAREAPPRTAGCQSAARRTCVRRSTASSPPRAWYRARW